MAILLRKQRMQPISYKINNEENNVNENYDLQPSTLSFNGKAFSI